MLRPRVLGQRMDVDENARREGIPAAPLRARPCGPRGTRHPASAQDGHDVTEATAHVTSSGADWRLADPQVPCGADVRCRGRRQGVGQPLLVPSAVHPASTVTARASAASKRGELGARCIDAVLADRVKSLQVRPRPARRTSSADAPALALPTAVERGPWHAGLTTSPTGDAICRRWCSTSEAPRDEPDAWADRRISGAAVRCDG